MCFDEDPQGAEIHRVCRDTVHSISAVWVVGDGTLPSKGSLRSAYIVCDQPVLYVIGLHCM